MIRKILDAGPITQENKNIHHGNMRCDKDFLNNVYINKDSDDNVIL